VLKMAPIPYIFACHLQIDADPDPDSVPAYHFDADPNPNPDPTFQLDADPCGSGSSTLDYGTADIKVYSFKQNCTNNKQSREISQFIQQSFVNSYQR
jgi:hypothetical protein